MRIAVRVCSACAHRHAAPRCPGCASDVYTIVLEAARPEVVEAWERRREGIRRSWAEKKRQAAEVEA